MADLIPADAKHDAGERFGADDGDEFEIEEERSRIEVRRTGERVKRVDHHRLGMQHTVLALVDAEAAGQQFAINVRSSTLHNADVVSLHCPLTSETANFVDAIRLSSMKQTAYLVNVSRGDSGYGLWA